MFADMLSVGAKPWEWPQMPPWAMHPMYQTPAATARPQGNNRRKHGHKKRHPDNNNNSNNDSNNNNNSNNNDNNNNKKISKNGDDTTKPHPEPRTSPALATEAQRTSGPGDNVEADRASRSATAAPSANKGDSSAETTTAATSAQPPPQQQQAGEGVVAAA